MDIPAGYVKVSPVFLQAEEPLKVSLFIFMPLNKKIIQFQKKGDILPTDKLLELMRLSASQILTPINEAQGAMSAVTEQLADQIQSSHTITTEASTTATRVVQTLSLIQGKDPPTRLQETRSLLDDSANMVGKIVTLFKESGTKKGFEDIFKAFKNDGNSLETHHKHCAALSVLLLLSFGEGNSNDISELAFASISHDLGLKELPKSELIRHVEGGEIKAILSPTPASQIDFHIARTRHIDGTLRILKESQNQISEGVFKIISQHHENFDGSGPIGISGRKIYGPARILRLVDDIIALLGGVTGINDLEAAFQGLKAANMKNGQPRFYDEELIAQLDKVMHGH